MSSDRRNSILDHLRQVMASTRANESSDRGLVESFAADRDGVAFSALMQRHGPMVLNLCRRVLRHDQDAEDAFQATFLALARKAGSVGRREAVAAWLYKVA